MLELDVDNRAEVPDDPRRARGKRTEPDSQPRICGCGRVAACRGVSSPPNPRGGQASDVMLSQAESGRPLLAFTWLHETTVSLPSLSRVASQGSLDLGLGVS
jgi:hypothetical protein